VELQTWQKIRQLRAYLKKITSEDFATKTTDEKKEILKLQRAERLYTYRYDFHKFCLEVLHAQSWGEPPCPWAPFHKRLCRVIRSARNQGKNLFVQVPRYHLKTQICTIFYRIWRLVHDPELCSLIVSGTLELSKGTTRAIRAELQGNSNLRELYAHVLPDWVFNNQKNKWSETQLNVARTTSYPQCTVEAVGVEATVTGKHFGEISMDDLVTPENSTTAEQCQKVIQAYRYFLSIKNPKTQRGRIPILVVGTPYTDSDLYSFLKQPEVVGTFKVFIQPVFDENGKPIWPEMYDEEKLREIAAQQGTYTFSTQYLLDPVPEEQMEFRKAWLQIYRILPRDINDQEIPLTKYIVVDPVTAKKTSSSSDDRGVILVVGVDKALNWYILDYKLYSRAKESEMFAGLFELSERWNAYVVGWECVAYQLQGKHNLEEEAQRTGRRLRVVELRPGHTDKDIRIRSLIPYFERGQIFIKYWMTELLLELQRFPKGKTKDIIDSLAYMLQMIPAKKKVGMGRFNQVSNTNKPFYL
jgi:phage terminase large subunit-like protein